MQGRGLICPDLSLNRQMSNLYSRASLSAQRDRYSQAILAENAQRKIPGLQTHGYLIAREPNPTAGNRKILFWPSRHESRVR